MIHTTQEWKIGDCIELMREMPPESVDTVITSPPYWGLRNYNVDGQIGMEPTLEEYHERLLEVTAECMRVLKPTGVMFWNHGDSYGGSGNASGHTDSTTNCGKPTAEYGATKGHTVGYMPKCMLMQNERLIIRMIDDQGWILRNRIIWHKNNGMPSSATDRFSNKYEPVYMLVKSKKYWFDLDAVRVPATYQEVWSRKGAGKDTPYNQNNPRSRWGLTKHEIATQRTSGSYSDPLHQKPVHPSGMKNPGDVWTIPTQPYPESHFATFPTALIEPMIKAGCPPRICPVCGMVRERVVSKDVINPRTINGIKDSNTQYCDGEPKTGSRFGDVRSQTSGWTSCSCGAGYVAGTVLDPFCGSGTVLEVCRRMNRNAIGLELNPEYDGLIKERSMTHTPPLTSYCEEENDD